MIAIGNVSNPLSLNYQSSGALFGATLQQSNPLQIAMTTYALNEQYSGDAADPTLRGVGNYLLFLCGKFQLQAQNIISGSGGGSIIPVPPTMPVPYLIPISNTDFTDATHYNNSKIVGQNLAIFFNDLNRYIYSPSEWVATSTGINILIPGFDATQNVYHLFIYILD